MMSSMLVVGSTAFDTLHNALGTHRRVLGGSAVYASLCGSFFAQPKLVGVVGRDFPDEVVESLRQRRIDLGGLEVAPGDTFHWEGRYSDDLTSRETLKTELNVFADFRPKIPDDFRDAPFVMLGNIDPELQLSVLDQVDRPKLVVADTMNFWIDSKLPELKKLLRRIDVLVINEEEARQLAQRHHIKHVAQTLLGLGPRHVIIKQGEYGAMLFVDEADAFNAPAYPLDEVRDPTGAGDSFAGGFLGSLCTASDVNTESMRSAVVAGSVMASFCVEGIGPERLFRLTSEEIKARTERFRELVRFG